MRMNKGLWSALACTALLAAGCDPEAPVQSSNVTEEIEGAIAEHAANPTTHSNLLFPAANIDGLIEGDQLEDGAIGIAQIGIDAVGSEEIANQSIAQADMSSNSIGTLQIQDDAITNAKLAANAVTAAEIAAGAISGGVMGAIADNSITTADVLNDSLTGADINDGTIASADITDDSLNDNDIVNDSLTSASLANDSVGANELANNAVDANALQTDAVTTAKIMNDNVTTAKIADLAITHAKLNTNMSGRGTNGNAVMVFQIKSKEGMNNPNFTIKGSCRSNAAASVVIWRNATQMQQKTGQCADTLASPNETFTLTLDDVDTDDVIEFQYDSAAMGDTTVWEIYSIGF